MPWINFSHFRRLVALASCSTAFCVSGCRGQSDPAGRTPAEHANSPDAAVPPSSVSSTATNEAAVASSDSSPTVDQTPSGSAINGPLSEEQFKALHSLRADDPQAKVDGIKVTLSDGSQAYLALPRQATPPLAAVVVVHEWWGLNRHIQHWSDRLADAGYAALAVDLYQRQVATTSDEALNLVKAVKPREANKTLLAAYDFLGQDPRIQAKKRGSIGWCFGGTQAFNLALAAPELDATVVYYGHVPTDPKALKGLKSPVLAIFGQRDASIPLSDVESFDQALRQLKIEHRVLTYAAEHAFANPSGAHYDSAAAQAAWTETLSFLTTHLKN